MIHAAPSRMRRADRARERSARLGGGRLGMNAPGGKHGSPGSDGEWEGVRTTRVPSNLSSTVPVARAHLGAGAHLGAVTLGPSDSDMAWLADYAQRVDHMRYDMAVQWAETVYDAQAFFAETGTGFPCAVTVSWNNAVDSFVAVVEDLYDKLIEADTDWGDAGQPTKIEFVSRMLHGPGSGEPIGRFATPECGEQTPGVALALPHEYAPDLPWGATVGAGAIAGAGAVGFGRVGLGFDPFGLVVLLAGVVVAIGFAGYLWTSDVRAVSEANVEGARASGAWAQTERDHVVAQREACALWERQEQRRVAAGLPPQQVPPECLAPPAPRPAPAAGGTAAGSDKGSEDDGAFPSWVKPIIGVAAVAGGVMLIITLVRRSSEPARMPQAV